MRYIGRLLSPLRVQLFGFVLIFLMSALGFALSGAGADSFYKSLQLFGLNYDVSEIDDFEPHFLVQIGRFLAPVLTIFALIELISQRLVGWIRNLLQATHSDRILLLGHGQINRVLLKHYLNSASHAGPVTVVDRSFDEASLKRGRAEGVLMLEADVTDPDAIRRLRPHNAKAIYVACGSDVLNLEVASEVVNCIDQTLRPSPGRTPQAKPYRYGCNDALEEIVNVHVASPKLMNDMVRAQEISFPLGSGLRFFSFKVATATALINRARFPMRARDIDCDTPHLVICCAGEMGEAILVQTLTTAISNNRIPKITVIDSDKMRAHGRMNTHYPRLFDGSIPDFEQPVIEFIEADLETSCFETDTKFRELDAQANPPTAWVFASRSDELNITSALRLETAMHRGALRQVPVFARAWEGQLALGDHELGGTRLFGRLDDKDVCRLITSKYTDQIARQIHSAYTGEKVSAELGPTNSSPFTQEWMSLPEDARQSSFKAAEHLPQRIEDLGFDWRGRVSGIVPRLSYEDPPLGYLKSKSNDNDFKGLPVSLEISARTEHQRWVVERAISGWQAGLRNNRTKRHPRMVTYDELSEVDQSLDLTSLNAALLLSEFESSQPVQSAWPRVCKEYCLNGLDHISKDATTIVLHFGRDNWLIPTPVWQKVETTLLDLRWHPKLCRLHIVVHGPMGVALALPQSDKERALNKELVEDVTKPFLRVLGDLVAHLPNGVAVDVDFRRQ